MVAKLAAANRSVRERLSVALEERDDIDVKLNNADSGLRLQMSREHELKRSIADQEAKRAHAGCSPPGDSPCGSGG